MQSLSPIYNTPSTPANSRTPLQHRPLNSSPLAAQNTKMSSPLTSAQARRRSQYKPQIPSTPSSAGKFLSRRLSSAGNTPTMVEDDPQKAFLRGRFKARCIERAVKARETALRSRRSGTLSEPSSDDFPMDDDEEEDDEDIMQDEVSAHSAPRRSNDVHTCLAISPHHGKCQSKTALLVQGIIRPGSGFFI